MAELINLIKTNIQDTLSESFLEYAGYNIQRRAIPDVRDGLKWGARQLLYSQMLGGFTYDKPFKKAIKSVSQAMGFCYVHGDASAYGTFIRMAKPFSYRYPLQEANGNYGTLINPDDHSASRYVELRGSKIAAQVLEDIKKETITEWEDTYDMEGQFPKVLPSKGLWLGVNGCISIGSGMSCSIPPTNLKEVNQILIKLIDNPDLPDNECVCLPDFPTGATIINKNDTVESMKNGTGFACKIRATVEWDSKDRCFIVTEMPYSTFTNTICNELATLMEADENCGIIDFKDYTGEKPDLRIYLNKKANPDKVLKRLYKETSLETFFSINMVLLDHGQTPRVFTWKEMLQAHIDHEKEIYRRGFEYDLRKIENRIHIIDGLLICLANIDEVVHTIKSSASTAEASSALQQKFMLDAEQAKAVLDMKLSRLAHLEVKKLEDERNKLFIDAEHIHEILENEELFKNELKNGWREVSQKFGDDRRTKIIQLSEGIDDEPIEEKQLSLCFTNAAAVYVSETSTLYTQKRNGVGTKFKLDKKEFIIDNIIGKNTDEVLFFTNKGNFYHMKMNDFAIDEKQYLCNFINFMPSEHIVAATICSQKKNILFITKNGYLKKSDFSEYNLKRVGGAIAIKLDDGDEIVSVLFVNDEKIGIATESGNFIIVTTNDVRPIGRVARGVHGIKLNDGDFVVNARIIKDSAKEIVSISEDGYIKRTLLNEFNVQGKNTKGAKIQKFINDSKLADFLPINDTKEVIVISNSSCIKIKIAEIPCLSKNTQGVRAIKLADNDKVVNLNI